MRVRIATCVRRLEPDPDQEPLLAALASRGIDARMAAWDDPDEPWDAAIPTVIRSTWNYVHDLTGFLAWAARAARAAPLWNPLAIVGWNVHKSYLRQLADAGCAVIPTLFVDRGTSVDLGAALAARGFGEIVIKPTVGAGSFGTRRFAATDDARAEAQRFLDGLVAERDVMVQAYQRSVEDYGERSLVWIDGELSHAIRKAPRFSNQGESARGPMPIADDERDLARRALAPWTDQLLYARVDIARGDDGGPMLMELELVEPSLFLVQHPPALARLAEAIARRCRAHG